MVQECEPSITGKGKSKENNGKFKGQSKGSKGAKGSGKGKTSKTGIPGLENWKSQASSETQESVQMGQVYTTDTSWIHDECSPDEWNDGWSLDEWNDDWRSVGWHEDCTQTCDTSVSSFFTLKLRMGEDEPGHRSCSQHIPIELWSRRSRRWKFLRLDSRWWSLAIPRLRRKRIAQISEWKTHGCTRSVVQHCISICTSTSISGCWDRVLGTTRLLCGTQWWLHDSDSK